MENIIEPNPENLMLELKRRAKNELVDTRDKYEDLVEEVVEEKISQGEFAQNEDTESLEDELKKRWPEVEEYISRSETEKP